ncbi:MAG: DNA cytosine methyltransferase [Erythrobacter sp.]
MDFFCGTGGFSLGAANAGFNVVGAYDVDENLTFSHRANFPDTNLVLRDVADLKGREVIDVFGEEIDLIFGGPPCQGFSMIGHRSESDPRRDLLGHFFRLVTEIRPKAFVMENVEGLLLGQARTVLNKAQRCAKSAGYTVLEPMVLNAADFGAPTKRRRAFVIGFLPNRCATITTEMFQPNGHMAVTVGDALSGLSSSRPLAEKEVAFDQNQMTSSEELSDYARKLASPDLAFTGNHPTKHTSKVVKRFSKVRPGKSDPIGKHHRLRLDGLCPTLRAGTGSDKGSFQSVRPIHPVEDRVITVREAARLQGFPDRHLFHPTKWHSFRQIGNSVSPIISKEILSVVYRQLKDYAQALEFG